MKVLFCRIASTKPNLIIQCERTSVPFASIAFRKEKEEIMTIKLSRTQQDMHAAMVLPTCADGAGHHACLKKKKKSRALSGTRCSMDSCRVRSWSFSKKQARRSRSKWFRQNPISISTRTRTHDNVCHDDASSFWLQLTLIRFMDSPARQWLDHSSLAWIEGLEITHSLIRLFVMYYVPSHISQGLLENKVFSRILYSQYS